RACDAAALARRWPAPPPPAARSAGRSVCLQDWIDGPFPSPSRFRTRGSDPLRHCSVRWAPAKAAGPCALGPHVRPTARVRGAAPAAALPACAGGRGIVNAFCPPRHLESLLRLFGQAAPRRVQLVVPCL